MKVISARLYECTAEEVKTLPFGFQFLESNMVSGTLRTMQAGIDTVSEDPQKTYLLFKEPPVEWQGRVETKSRRKPDVTDKLMRRALENV